MRCGRPRRSSPIWWRDFRCIAGLVSPDTLGRCMKILVVADIHYALPQFDWVVEVAPRYDLVVIAGDLLDTNSLVDPGTQIVVVLKYLRKLRELARLVVCSGNHDLDAVGPGGEKQALWMEEV